MTQITVNGMEQSLPLEEKDSLSQAIQFVRKNYVSDTTWISSIKVNGNEVGGTEEGSFSEVPLSEIRSIEILTTHPRELADDTLRTLIEFSAHLEAFCGNVARQLAERGPSADFEKLLDGIGTFTESLVGAKQVLRVGSFGPIDVLEADLLSILKDVLEFFRKKDYAYVAELLRDPLTANLRQWREQGLPALVRSRDS